MNLLYIFNIAFLKIQNFQLFISNSKKGKVV